MFLEVQICLLLVAGWKNLRMHKILLDYLEIFTLYLVVLMFYSSNKTFTVWNTRRIFLINLTHDIKIILFVIQDINPFSVAHIVHGNTFHPVHWVLSVTVFSQGLSISNSIHSLYSKWWRQLPAVENLWLIITGTACYKLKCSFWLSGWGEVT